MRVLVVEDDPDIALLIDRQLTMRGCEVVKATANFHELLTTDLSGFDAVTIDLMLGAEATGVEILGMLYQTYPKVRRVIVSAVADRDKTLDALADAVVLKPWNEEDLWKAVAP